MPGSRRVDAERSTTRPRREVRGAVKADLVRIDSDCRAPAPSR